MDQSDCLEVVEAENFWLQGLADCEGKGDDIDEIIERNKQAKAENLVLKQKIEAYSKDHLGFLACFHSNMLEQESCITGIGELLAELESEVLKKRIEVNEKKNELAKKQIKVDLEKLELAAEAAQIRKKKIDINWKAILLFFLIVLALKLAIKTNNKIVV